MGIIYEGESLGEAFGFQVGELLAHGIKCLKLEAHIDDLMLFGQQWKGFGRELELVDIKQAEEAIFNGFVGFIYYLDHLAWIRGELDNFWFDSDAILIHSVSMKVYYLKNS